MSISTSINRRGGSLRAIVRSLTIASATGVVATAKASLLAPVTYGSKTGNANLSISSSGEISATAALAAGASQTIGFLATGADGCTQPWSMTLTGTYVIAAITATVSTTAAAGVIVANITGIPPGQTPAISPADGRFVIAGDEGSGWKLARGLSAVSVGTFNGSISAAGATPGTVTLTIEETAIVTPIYGLITTVDDGSIGQTYTLNAAWTEIQWYRKATAAPYAETLIAGATSATYVSQAADENYRLAVRGKDGGVSVARMTYHVMYLPPLILEPFETAAGFVTVNDAVLSVVTDGAEYGSNRLQMEAAGTANPRATKASIGNFDPSLLGTIAFCGDLGMDEARVGGKAEVVLIRAGTEYPLTGGTDTGTNYETPSALHIGKLWGGYHVSELPGLSVPGTSNMGLYIRNPGNIPHTQQTKYDALLGRAGGRPTVILGFDDNKLTQYQNAFPILQARGFPGTFYVAEQLTRNSSFMTTAMLQEMYAAGWDCGLDSTHNDDISSSFGTMEAWEASFQLNRDYAIAQGMTRGNEHIVYTHGQIETNPPSNRVSVASATFNGTPVVSGIPSTTGITVGMRAVGLNVPNSPITTVTQILSATEVQLSASVPTQTKPIYFVDTSPEFYTMKLPRRVAELGIRTARTTRAQEGYLSRFGFGDRGMFTFAQALHNTTYANFVAIIDRAILRGTTIEWYTHGVFAGGSGTESDIVDFTQKMDYLALKRDQGLLDVMTWSQVWARDGNAGVPAGLASPPSGPVSNIAFVAGSTASTTPAAPAGQLAGDLLIAAAYRDGSTPAPTIPAGWTQLASEWASNSGITLAYRIATADAETIGAFTNATNVLVHCYRGASGVGNVSPVATGASGNVVIPAGWALQVTNNTSWIAYFGGSRSSGSNLDTNGNRTGHTNATSASDAGGGDTLGAVSASSSVTVGTSGGSQWHAIAVEIKA